MTDNFMDTTDDQTGGKPITNLLNSDQAAAGGVGNEDTHSPEYQIQKMQQRMQDKDTFIKQLQDEANAARAEAAKRDDLLQNMDRISEVLSKQGQQGQGGSNQDTTLDKDALVGEVIKNLKLEQAEDTMKANYSKAVDRLKSHFGEQHVEAKVQEAAQSNGLSVPDMKEMARKSPEAFYKLVGVAGGQQAHSPQPTRGNQAAPVQSNERDLAFFARLMRENPREYWKADTQREFRSLFTQKKDN